MNRLMSKRSTPLKRWHREELSLRPIVWQARALKRQGRVGEAIAVLDDGLKTRGANDEPFRRAVAYWNRACYKCVRGADNHAPQSIASVIDDLQLAVENQPDFAKSLSSS